MIAYKPEWLHIVFIRQQASDALHKGQLHKEEWENISGQYTSSFYSPNFFIRVGLFILTTVIVLFSFGLFSLMFLSAIEHAVGAIAIFFAIVAYAALEYMVQSKRHLQSGVDDALLWISASCLFGGISYLSDAGELANCIIIFFISIFCVVRFADRVMALIAFVAMLGAVFFTCIKLGEMAKAFVPFTIALISLLTWFWVKRKSRLDINLLYANCLKVVMITALLCVYFSLNYFVVRELSNEMFNLNLAENQSIPFAWVFWIFTVLIPFVYIGLGIQRKDTILIRVGLLVVAVFIFTLRYYYFIGSVEMMMTAGGIFLILTAYGLTRFLKTPKYGFTNLEISDAKTSGNLQVEALLQVQTLSGQAAGQQGTQFGGGNFGGGGASGEF